MQRFFLKKNFVFLMIASLVFALYGCGGGGGSSSNFDNSASTSGGVKQVAVLTSPAFQMNSSYRIYKGAELSDNIGTHKYYIANIGNESEQATLNLGLIEKLANNDTLVVMNDATKNVVFAYNPYGTNDTPLTSGVLTINENTGKRLKYNSLSMNTSSLRSAIEIESDYIYDIRLDGKTAYYSGDYYPYVEKDEDNENVYADEAVHGWIPIPTINYVWHADPNHAEEYWTEYSKTTPEYSASDMEDIIYSALEVPLENSTLQTYEQSPAYVAYDVRYMSSTLSFSASNTATKDGEEEYIVKYNSSIGSDYIFATLPMGSSGQPGGNPPNNRAGSTSDLATVKNKMTFTATQAYNNPVLHLRESGTYRLTGTWNGQIWVDADERDVTLILNGVEVTCGVAPALVFYNVSECDDTDEDGMAEIYGILNDTDTYDSASEREEAFKDNFFVTSITDYAGAKVFLNPGTTNKFTGANLYRILKPELRDGKDESTLGSDIGAQSKLYKIDGAFHSMSSMAIGGTGTLEVTSTTYEGLDTERHMTLEDATVKVTAPDDGMNFNEDDISMFVMLGGSLTVSSENADGIDSNGYIVILDADKLDVTAVRDSSQLNAEADGPLDADDGVYMNSAVQENVYKHQAYNGGSTAAFTISADKKSLSLTAGGTSSLTMTATNNSGTVTYTTNYTWAVVNNNVINITAPSTADTYNLIITGKDNNTTTTATVPITVTSGGSSGGSFTITPSKTSLILEALAVDNSITLQSDASGTVSYQTNQSWATVSNAVLTITAPAYAGPYTIRVTGMDTENNTTSYVDIALTVTGGPIGTFSMTVSPTNLTIAADDSANATLTLYNAFGNVDYSPSHSWVNVTGNTVTLAPTTTGKYTVIITATDAAGREASADIAVTVTESLGTFSLNVSNSSVTTAVGSSAAVLLSTTNAQNGVNYQSSQTWAVINGDYVIITPTTAGNQSVIITATDGEGRVDRKTITVYATDSSNTGTFTITPSTSSLSLEVGATASTIALSYSNAVGSVNFSSSQTWAVISGNRLSITAPSTTGTHLITITGTDSTGKTATAVINLTVTASTNTRTFSIMATPSSATITVGSPVTAILTPVNATGTVGYTSSASWATVNDDMVTLAPPTAGTFTVTITGVDTAGHTARTSIAVTARAAYNGNDNTDDENLPAGVTLSDKITTDRGTTSILLSTSVKYAEDDDGTARNIATSSNVFKLVKKVNTFWNITAE